MAEEKMNQNGAAGEACTDTGQPETSAAAGQEAEKAAEEKKDTMKDPSGAEKAGDKKETEDSVKDASKEEAAAAKDSGRGFFGKKSSKEKALQEQIDGLNDKVKRQMAEFDNYRKRTEKEKQQQFSLGERDVIEKLLPVNSLKIWASNRLKRRVSPLIQSFTTRSCRLRAMSLHPAR